MQARVFTPETTFDRMVTMAIERGKFGELPVDTLDGAGPHALSRALVVLAAASPNKAAKAVEPLHSVFMRRHAVRGARRQPGKGQAF